MEEGGVATEARAGACAEHGPTLTCSDNTHNTRSTGGVGATGTGAHNVPAGGDHKPTMGEKISGTMDKISTSAFLTLHPSHPLSGT